ncbi:MAG: VOC family protein [Burkholderiales bacterium]|nr:VOC family protein [Burkholderiales bacterium]
MTLQRVHHIVVRVKDLEQGIAAYQALGLTLERTAESAALGIKQAFFPLADGAFIEVVSPTRADSAVGKALEGRGEGIHSIVFKVDDVARAAQGMKARGVALIGEGGPQVFVHPKSSHGVLVQLTDKQ